MSRRSLSCYCARRHFGAESTLGEDLVTEALAPVVPAREAGLTSPQDGRSPEATRRLARIAGAAYMAWALATVFGFYHAPLVSGDLHALARALVRSDVRFRVGVVVDLVTTVSSVPVALLLYQLLERVNRAHAFLMALLLILAMPISFVVALNYVAAQWLLSDANVVTGIPPETREALAMLFLRLHAHGVLAVEVFWGLWFLPLGVLVIRSGFLPRLLGRLIIIAGTAYVVHSITSLALGGERVLVFERITLLAKAAGEFPLMLWLLIKGAAVRPSLQQAFGTGTESTRSQAERG
jgi:hypothetical protein